MTRIYITPSSHLSHIPYRTVLFWMVHCGWDMREAHCGNCEIGLSDQIESNTYILFLSIIFIFVISDNTNKISLNSFRQGSAARHWKEWIQVLSNNHYPCSCFEKWNVLSVIQYSYVIMGSIASQITSLTIFNSIVYSDADQRKHQSSASLAFVWGIHRWPVNSPHKWPVTRKMLPFDDVIMVIARLPHTYWRPK